MLKKLKEGMALGVGIYLTFMLLDIVLRLVVVALALILGVMSGPSI
jgi:flagellar biosynthesis protein FliP